MQTTSIGTREECALTVAHWIATETRRALATNRKAVVALPGGRSVTGPLARLRDEEVDWANVEIFFADERHLPPGHEDRNDTLVDELLVGPLIARERLTPSQFHRVRWIAGQPAEAALAYWRELQRFGAHMSVLLLGVGEDGHIASLFPGREELTVDKAGVLAIRDSPKPPPERITISPGLVRAAQAVCLLFFGSGKRDALDAFHDGAVNATACPAKLAANAQSLLVVADYDAAGSVNR